jgi:hypothetical protein
MRSLGFTGTQAGMTPAQKESVILFLEGFAPQAVHHGDCIGADAEFHHFALNVIAGVSVHIHPPKISSKRAFCKGGHFTYPTKDYLVRNVDIVEQSQELLATPKEFMEEQRSGTWYTIRQARKRRKAVNIIYPDGRLVREEPSPSLFDPR